MIITQHAEQRAKERYNLSLYKFRDSIISQFKNKTARPVGYKSRSGGTYMVSVGDAVMTLAIRFDPMRVVTVLDTNEMTSRMAFR